MLITPADSQHSQDKPAGELPLTIWTRNFTLLCLANFVFFMSTQMLFPTLPIYIMQSGGGQKEIGYVMGIYTICAMAMRPAAGWLVDSYGRKKVMVAGMVMMVMVSYLYHFTTSVALLMFIRGLHGLAFGLAGTAVSTMVADILPTSRLGEGMGYFGLTSSVSMSIAPVIGFWLVENFGYHVLFYSVLSFAALAFASSLPVRGTVFPASLPGERPGGIWASLVEKTAVPASGVMFFLAIVYGSVLSYISLLAMENGISNIGLFFTAMAVTMIVSRPVSGRWSDRGGTHTVIFIGLLVMAAGMTATALSHTMSAFIWAGALLGTGLGFAIPTLQALAVRLALPDRRGAATGTFFVAFDLGIGLGAIIWGYVAGFTGYQIMFFSTLLPLLICGLIYLGLKRSRIYEQNAAVRV